MNLHEEFLAEANEIIETLSRDLLLLDQAQKEGRVEPQRINDVFRGIHTLKGIAGMFGFPDVSGLSHSLEDLLDSIRLGRVALDAAVLDVLFEGIELLQLLLSEEERGAIEMSGFLAQVAAVASGAATPSPTEELDLGADVWSVLTEYEEHRLRTNVEAGVPIYRLRIAISLATIDTELAKLRERTKDEAEIITYLPSTGGEVIDSIELDVLIASSLELEALHVLLGSPERSSLRPVGKPAIAPQRVSSIPPPPRVHQAMTEIPEGPEESQSNVGMVAVANTVRVDIRKLDRLMNAVGELTIVRSAVAALSDRMRSGEPPGSLLSELHRISRGFERRLSELQSGVLDVRMVPLQQVFDRVARVIRQVAREHDKEVQLIVSGGETEVDKLIVEELVDPLMHLVRNAIDHGIETPKARELRGKDAVGRILLNAYQKGSHVVLELEDDGAGMRAEELSQVAVARGLLTAESASELSATEAYELIFQPGFSTSESVSDTSGRGVGMDVVRTNIAHLGGIVSVSSEPGIGTKFTLTLPVTLAIIRALLLRIGGMPFALPIAAVQEVLQFHPSIVTTIEGREVVTLRGNTLPLCHLDRLFSLPHDATRGPRFIVVVRVGEQRVGFVTGVLDEQRDIIIKPLGEALSMVRGFSGATDLGDQRVALVLDASALVDKVIPKPGRRVERAS